jgi:hypothetical protein
MNLEKTAKALGDWRTIWLGVLMLISIAAWAGDSRWLQIADGGKIVVQVELSSMQRSVEELEVQKVYETDPQKIKMIEALINIKKSKMDALIKKHSLN